MTENNVSTKQAEPSREIVEASPEELSTNFYWTCGNTEIFNLQTTVRGTPDAAEIDEHLQRVRLTLLMVVNNYHGHAKQVGKQYDASAVPLSRPTGATVSNTGEATGKGIFIAPPAPVMPAHASSGANQESHCALIKLVASYTGNKPQIEFECDGLEHPLKYTRTPQDMAKLLAPIGFSMAHICDPANGAFRLNAKYSADCIVVWNETSKEGKTYKNVVSVRPV